MPNGRIAEDVHQWLRAGAEINAGLRLFDQISTNRHFARMVAANPSKYRPMLIAKLCTLTGIDPSIANKEQQTPLRPKFREQYPFLRETGCPPELKILAADKLTAWENYTQAHAALFDCTSPEECYTTARKVLDNYLENRQIFEELDYYLRHRTPLGVHPIFERLRKIRAFRKLSIPELFKAQKRLQYRVWWLRKVIEKNDKPHLRENREELLAEYEAQLLEVDKIIAAYARKK